MKYRSEAGLECFIIRSDHGGCCKWCAALAGKYRYPEEVPKDVYRRHDNCTCTVTYTNGRKAQDVWSKTSRELPAEERERMKQIGFKKPTISAEEREQMLIAGMKKPTVSLVLGGGHSIGIPLAVSARRSMIVPTASMTVHPVRHSGMVLGVPQTLRYFEQMQERIVSFVAGHSGISAKRFTQLMHNTGELVMDMGTVLGGEQAVEEGLIDAIGNLGDALRYLYAEIDAGKTGY